MKNGFPGSQNDLIFNINYTIVQCSEHNCSVCKNDWLSTSLNVATTHLLHVFTGVHFVDVFFSHEYIFDVAVIS